MRRPDGPRYLVGAGRTLRTALPASRRSLTAVVGGGGGGLAAFDGVRFFFGAATPIASGVSIRLPNHGVIGLSSCFSCGKASRRCASSVPVNVLVRGEPST